MLLSEQIILVTGGSRGIGRGIVNAFAKTGATVIATATSEEGAQQISQALTELNAKGRGYCLDITNANQCQTIFEQICTDFDAPQVLINNAGITRDNLFLRMKEDEWDAIIDTHLNGLFYMCKLAVKPMIKKHYGRIINISSIVGAIGNPGQVNYVTAKAGMIGFTKALAIEIASRQITVNAVAPGFIDTAMTQALSDTQREKLLAQIPTGRLGTPEDIANACLFLAAPESSYITGQTLHVNGGMYCH